MAWLVGTSGTRSRWLFPLVLVQFWLFMLMFIVGYFVTMPSNFVHQRDPEYLQITHMPQVLYSADTSMFMNDCLGVVTLSDLAYFPISSEPVSVKTVLIKPAPMFEYCAIGTQQKIPTAITEMLEPICRVAKPLYATTSATGQAEFNLCQLYGPPGLYSLHFELSGKNSDLNVSISLQMQMMASPYRLKLNDEAPALIEPGCNNSESKTCVKGPQNARAFFGNEPVPNLRVVLTAVHSSMLPHILGVRMPAIRSITRWPALSMVSYGAAMLSDSEVISDAFGLFNFSVLNVLGYTTPTISLAVYFGGRLQLWSGVKNLNGVYWVRESAIRRQFSARMNAPCAVKTQPVVSDGLITILPDNFFRLSGKFCSFKNDESGTVELGLSRRVGFIHIVPSFDIAVLDSARSREYFKHPLNASTSVSLADGVFNLITKFSSEGQSGIYTLYFIADGQTMLSRRLSFTTTFVQVASMFLPLPVQKNLVTCQKSFLRSDPCYMVEPFSSLIGSEHSPSIRLTTMEKSLQLVDVWHVGIMNIQARLYILPNNFTEFRAISAPNFLPNSLSFLTQESGIVSFPEVVVSHLSSSPLSLQYFSQQAKIQIEAATNQSEASVQRNVSSKHFDYLLALHECGIPTCSAVQVTKLPTEYSTPFPAPYQLMAVNEDLDIRASIFDSEFALQTSELIVLCAIFIKRHLWENGVRYPSNAYQGSRVCNRNSPSGWSSSQNRPSDFSEVRYVLEPGEYVWFLQADADLTNTVFKSLYKNQSFFFPPSSNLTNVTQFATQIPPKPLCRNAVDMAKKAYQRCRSNFFFGSFGVRLPIIQFDGSRALVATFQPSLDFVDLFSRANGAMKNMDAIPWWRAELKQSSEVYLQVNDYMLSGDSEDPADNPISQKYVGPNDRGACTVLHGSMEGMSGFSFSKSRNPSVPSGSVNDILMNYFFFTSLTLRWLVQEYTLLQCSINGVQSPILELFPVAVNPSQTYTTCGNYPEASIVSGATCVSRLKFEISSRFSCFPIGVILSNITFSMMSFDGTLLPQEQQANLLELDMDVKDSVVAEPFKIIRLNANQAQVSGLRFSFIRPGLTFLRLFIRGTTQRDSFMLSKSFVSAPDEVHYELVSGTSSFLIGGPAVYFLWKVSLILKCVIEDAFDNFAWIPPKVELFVAFCHSDAQISSFDKSCHISNEVFVDSGVIFQSTSADSKFLLGANVRLMGGSPDIAQPNWRLIAKTIQSDQIVWISDAIQISFGEVALKVLPSSNEVCFIGTRCVFELKATNPFGIPVPGAAVTVVDNGHMIRNFSFSPRFHSAVSDSNGLMTVSVELQEEVSGGFVVFGFITYGAGGARYFTTKNITVMNIVYSITDPGILGFSKDFNSKAFAPSFHFQSNKTDLTFLGIDTVAFLITQESGKDDKQLQKPTFNILNLLGNKIVVLKSESSIFLMDWRGDVVKNATTISEATASTGKDAFSFKFEFMVLNDIVPTGFYTIKHCFMGKCLQNKLEFFVKNTLKFDDTFAEAIFAMAVFMTIVVFALLPWSFHSDRPDDTSKKKMIIFFLCVIITTALQTQVASILKGTSMSKQYLREFDFIVTAYALIVPISICLCSLQALLSYYDSRFNSSETAFHLNEQLAIRLITGQEKTMKLIGWCKFTTQTLKTIQAQKIQQALVSRPKRQFRSDSLISIRKLKSLWGVVSDRFISAAIPTVSFLQHLVENYTPYETTAFQKVSEYMASPRLLICFVIPMILLPLLLFLVRVGVRIFQEIVYTSVYFITTSNVTWVRSNERVSMLDFFNDASDTSLYAGDSSIRHFKSDSILERIMLYFAQILLSRDVQLMHEFLNQLLMSANVASVLCIIFAVVGFCRFFMIYRKYVHELRERGRRVLIDSKINFAMHKSSSLVPGQFWSTFFGFFVAFLVFMLLCMIARWEPLKKYLANAVINPLIVTLVLHYVAVAASRISDSLLVPNLSTNSLWMPRRRLFSLYEFFITIFAWLSAAGSMIFRFIISAAFWICLSPMDFFQQKSLSLQSTDRDVVGSERFIASIGVDHVIDSPLTAALARLLIKNIDAFSTRLAFDKSKCDPLAIHLELQQYATREHRRFLMARWEFLTNLSSDTQVARDIKALRKPFLAASNYKKLPVTGFGSTENYWNIVKMDDGIRDWLKKKEKPALF